MFVVGLTWAQEQEDEDLKVGLVLSGGGAKGLAHIGALKVIEDAGVRIDYIGGTSMGAIVGALYASGYTARQLDSIFNKLDFEKLIQDDIPRRAKTFYEKDEAEKYAVTLPFEKFQIAFPSGISKGQNVYNLLSRLTDHVSEVEDFGKLPIPFFCVATNIETGEEVVLEKGYLPRAITASGALPSLFSPVTIDSTLYIDGGVVNNYPVHRVRAKGMDVVIGIDVQDSLRLRENLNSALEVLVQINNYRTINAMVEKRKETDVYIQPNINDFSVISFDRGNEIIKAGQDSAEAVSNSLKDIANRQKQLPKPKIDFSRTDNLFIKNVIIRGNKQYTRSYVLGKLKLKTPAQTSYEAFNQGVNNLSATGNFQDINYRFVPDPDNKEEYAAVFDLRESRSRTLLRFAAHYDDLYKTSALINITKKRLITNNDVASFDFIVGDNLRYNFDYYIDKGYYWSFGVSSDFNFFDKNVDADFVDSEELASEGIQINRINLEYTDLTNQVFIQTVFRRSFLLRLGIEHKWLRYLSETIGIDENNVPRTLFENSRYWSTYGTLRYDTFDNKYFPKSGIDFEGNFNLYLFAGGLNDNFKEFSIAKARAAYAVSFSDKLSAVISTAGGFKIGDRSTTSLDFFVGGYGYRQINNIVPLYGYEALDLRGNTYLKSDITLDYEFVRKNHVNISANIANVGDNLFETGAWIDGIDYSGYALGYGLETFLGPVELKYSYSPEIEASEWYVSVGFRF